MKPLDKLKQYVVNLFLSLNNFQISGAYDSTKNYYIDDDGKICMEKFEDGKTFFIYKYFIDKIIRKAVEFDCYSLIPNSHFYMKSTLDVNNEAFKFIKNIHENLPNNSTNHYGTILYNEKSAENVEKLYKKYLENNENNLSKLKNNIRKTLSNLNNLKPNTDSRYFYFPHDDTNVSIEIDNDTVIVHQYFIDYIIKSNFDCVSHVFDTTNSLYIKEIFKLIVEKLKPYFGEVKYTLESNISLFLPNINAITIQKFVPLTIK